MTTTRSWTYPWSTWLNGRQHNLTRGVDYNSRTFTKSARSAARRRGLRVQIWATDDGVAMIARSDPNSKE